MTSSGRTSPRAAGEEEERRFATVATGRVTLPESAQTLMRATEGAAAVVEVDEGRASRCATDVTGLATLLGSALRATVDAMLAEVAMEETQGVSEVDVILAAEAVDLSATSATGLATLPGSAGRRRTAATSVTGLGTLR